MKQNAYERSYIMEYVPGAVQVLISWLLLLIGTISTYLNKKDE